jgi:hypothetical protein
MTMAAAAGVEPVCRKPLYQIRKGVITDNYYGMSTLESISLAERKRSITNTTNRYSNNIPYDEDPLSPR